MSAAPRFCTRLGTSSAGILVTVVDPAVCSSLSHGYV